jgi:hypothetical protein
MNYDTPNELSDKDLSDPVLLTKYGINMDQPAHGSSKWIEDNIEKITVHHKILAGWTSNSIKAMIEKTGKGWNAKMHINWFDKTTYLKKFQNQPPPQLVHKCTNL